MLADVPSTAFNSGLGIRPDATKLGFVYGHGTFGPDPEYRRLDSIRQSLRDPDCSGPDPVYAIAMDTGRTEDAEEIRRRLLLFGVVVYSAGMLGEEPVRSQGHIHRVAPHCGWSTPELIEIWEGCAIVYVQEMVADVPGRCLAIHANPGQKVVVPPGWAHAVINADVSSRLMFGAWCDRQYGFVYDGIRAHGGLAWFAVVRGNRVEWESNPSYCPSQLVRRSARDYPELGLAADVPIYLHFMRNPESVQWVSDPGRYGELWKSFEP